MRKLTITCDRCGKEIEDHTESWKLGVFFDCSMYYSTHGCYTQPIKEVEWCRECVLALGLILGSEEEREKFPMPDPAPSIEDLIREIVREEIGEVAR